MERSSRYTARYLLWDNPAIADFYLRHFHTKWQNCDSYGLRHLAWHLIEAGKIDELHQLLLTFDWLQAKLDATDLAALIADYDNLPEDKDLRTVQSAALGRKDRAGQYTGHIGCKAKVSMVGMAGRER